MHRISLMVAASFALVCASACNVAAYDTETASIPLDLSGPRPTAQLQIGDNPPVTAIFDTGAAASVLRRGYADQLHMPNEGSAQAAGPGGAPVEGYRTTIQQGALGGAHFDNALAVAFDIPLPLPGIDAVISPAVFSGRLVRLDFPGSVAQILPRTAANIPTSAAEPYMGQDAHGQIRRTPAVRVELPGSAPLMAMADTGAPAGLRLPLDMASRLPLAGSLAPREPVRGVGMTRQAFTARLQGSMRVGPLTLENPEIVFVEGDYQPLVGAEILRGAILVLDPAAHRSWLLPPTAP